MAPKGDSAETAGESVTIGIRAALLRWPASSVRALTARPRADLEKDLARTKAQIATIRTQVERLPPGPRNEWPGLPAALLIKYPAPPPSPGSATQRLRAAIDDGWINRNPSPETTDALRILDRDVLWRALHLDARADALQARIRRDLRQRRDLERERSERWKAFRGAVQGLPQITAKRLGVTVEEVTDVTKAVETIEEALYLSLDHAITGRSMVEYFLADLDKKSRPHAAANWRGQQLAWLLQALRADSQRTWTRTRLAKLILSSTEDFVVSPCPVFVAQYEEAGVVALVEAIKKQIAKAGKIRPRTSSHDR